MASREKIRAASGVTPEARRRPPWRLAAIALLGFAATAHTPYSQWTVYRQKHLLILTHKADPATYALGKEVAGLLARHLPASRARVTRAPDEQRVASLLATHQLEVAILSRPQAAALAAGAPPFDSFDPLPLRALAGLGDYLLVCLSDFPDRHAYLVAGTLLEHGVGLVTRVDSRSGPGLLLLHPGARAYLEGGAVPAGTD